jgi:hypothetical protein
LTSDENDCLLKGNNLNDADDDDSYVSFMQENGNYDCHLSIYNAEDAEVVVVNRIQEAVNEAFLGNNNKVLEETSNSNSTILQNNNLDKSPTQNSSTLTR